MTVSGSVHSGVRTRTGKARPPASNTFLPSYVHVPPWPTALTTPHRSEQSSHRFLLGILMLTLLFTPLQKELQTFLEREQAQARVQQSIHTFTSMCWDKCVLLTSCPFPILTFALFFLARCITGTPSTRFSRGEETCLVNCVERFLDTSLFIVKKIESQRHGA
jgi:mitochondrial import inner membrane translocase subunit TIM8